MEAPLRPARALSVLGHPVTGLAPILLLSFGWVLLAVELAPRLRLLFRARALEPAAASILAIRPVPPEILLIGALSIGSLLLGLVLLLVWIRSAGGLGILSDRILARDERLAGLLVGTVGVLTAALLSRGEPAAAGATAQIAQGWLWHEALRSGGFPIWTDLWHGGFPAGQHEPPLSHLLQALLGFLRFDPVAAAKQLAWFCRMAGAAGFGLYCAQIHRDSRAGFLGGLIYGLAPAFHTIWMVDGRLPGLLVLAILPWALLAGDRLAVGIGGRRAGASLALAAGLLCLADAAQIRAILVLIGAAMLARAIPTVSTRGQRAPSIAGVSIGIAGGAGLAAGFLVPLARDLPHLSASLPEGWSRLALGLPDLGALPAASVALLAVAGLARSIQDRFEGGIGIGPIPLLALVLLPACLLSGSPRGFEVAMVGAMAAAAGSVRRPPRPRNGWVPRRGIYAIALLLVCLDLAPKSLRAGYRDGRAEGPDLHAVLEGRLASGRFLELPVMESGRIAADAGRYAPTRDAPSVGGPSVAYAPRSYAYQAAMIDSVAGALNSGKPLAAPLVDLLAYHNVRYLVVSSGGKAVAPPVAPGEGVAEEPSIPALRIDAAAPIAVLPAQAASFEPPPAIPPGGLSPETSRRLVREQIDWLAEVRPRPVREARAVVLPNRTVIEIPDLGAAVVRVARNHYPNTVVLLDGSPWPWRPGPCGGIQLSLVAGPHRIEIRGTEDRVRHAGRVGQWILFGLLFLVAIGPHRR